MRPEPFPCYACGKPAEADGFAPDGNRMIEDRRSPPGELFFGPLLCWDCRGVVLLQPPDRHLLVTPEGLGPALAALPPGAFPFLRWRRDVAS
jgi:hypothetical protein